MRNRRSEQAVGLDAGDQRAVLPRYADYCFAGLPWTIEALLAGRRSPRALPPDCFAGLGPAPRRILLLFVDAFGWRFFERYLDRSAWFARVLEDGVASVLTSEFPSTTAAHVATLHSGLRPSESGLYEWFQYEPELPGMVAPLLFSRVGERERGGLVAERFDPAAVFPFETLHQRLAGAGVASHCVTPAEFTPSPFNDQACRGAGTHAYTSLAEGLETAMRLVTAPGDEARFVMFYYAEFDKLCHRHGLDSGAARDCAGTLLAAIDQALLGPYRGAGGRCWVLFTADHGMCATDPAATQYVNRLWPGLVDALQTLPDGAPRAPAGSARDLFLHVKPERLDAVAERLRRLLDGQAEVHRLDDLLAAGAFGDTPPAPRFLERVGNLVVLPHPGRTVWWHEADRFVYRHLSDHGGLSPEEMLIPLLAKPL